MAILNVTHNGHSKDHAIDVPYSLSDHEVRRLAEEASGQPAGTFRDYVVDRFTTPQQGERLYLRPKVPFG